MPITQWRPGLINPHRRRSRPSVGGAGFLAALLPGRGPAPPLGCPARTTLRRQPLQSCLACSVCARAWAGLITRSGGLLALKAAGTLEAAGRFRRRVRRRIVLGAVPDSAIGDGPVGGGEARSSAPRSVPRASPGTASSGVRYARVFRPSASPFFRAPPAGQDVRPLWCCCWTAKGLGAGLRFALVRILENVNCSDLAQGERHRSECRLRAPGLFCSAARLVNRF